MMITRQGGLENSRTKLLIKNETSYYLLLNKSILAGQS